MCLHISMFSFVLGNGEWKCVQNNALFDVWISFADPHYVPSVFDFEHSGLFHENGMSLSLDQNNTPHILVPSYHHIRDCKFMKYQLPSLSSISLVPLNSKVWRAIIRTKSAINIVIWKHSLCVSPFKFSACNTQFLLVFRECYDEASFLFYIFVIRQRL